MNLEKFIIKPLGSEMIKISRGFLVGGIMTLAWVFLSILSYTIGMIAGYSIGFKRGSDYAMDVVEEKLGLK